MGGGTRTINTPLLGSTVSSPPAGFETEPQLKWNLMHFGVKIWHIVAPVFIIFGNKYSACERWKSLFKKIVYGRWGPEGGLGLPSLRHCEWSLQHNALGVLRHTYMPITVVMTGLSINHMTKDSADTWKYCGKGSTRHDAICRISWSVRGLKSHRVNNRLPCDVYSLNPTGAVAVTRLHHTAVDP